jgi:hypothetical protein
MREFREAEKSTTVILRESSSGPETWWTLPALLELCSTGQVGGHLSLHVLWSKNIVEITQQGIGRPV